MLTVLSIVLVCGMPGFATEVLSPPDALYKRCLETRDDMSCFELASFLEKAKKKSKGDKVALFACRRMTGKQCAVKQAYTLRDEHLRSKKEWEAAQEKLILENQKTERNPNEVKCEHGQGDACERAGLYYQFLAPQVDAARARRLYEKGCDLKDASSCDSLDLMRKGIGKVYNVDVSTPADEGATAATNSNHALDFLKDEDWFPSGVGGAKTPCDSKATGEACTIGPGGWHQVAMQKYDERSPTVTIWEFNGRRVICAFPGRSKKCPAYGGDLKSFIEDAERETAARKKIKMEEELRQKKIAEDDRQTHKDEGPELKKDGWKEIARCEGHEWRYLIEKGGKRMLCTGINAHAGPTEYPCVPFGGRVDEFRKCSHPL